MRGSRSGRTLPDDFDDMNPDAQVLLADRCLIRADLVRSIKDTVDADFGTSGGTHFDHTEMARLLRTVAELERPVRFVRDDHPKDTLRGEIGDALGVDVDTDADRGEFTKVELIRIWLTVTERGNGHDDRDLNHGMVSSA